MLKKQALDLENYWTVVADVWEADLADPDKLVRVEGAWREDFPNLVTDEGKNAALSALLKTGITPGWYVFLKANGTPAAGDTMASHATWSEDTNYSGNRKAWTPGTVASKSVDNSGSVASFAMNNTTTIYGCGLHFAASGTSGTLYCVGDFTASRAVSSGDTLQVTVTCTAS